MWADLLSLRSFRWGDSGIKLLCTLEPKYMCGVSLLWLSVFQECSFTSELNFTSDFLSFYPRSPDPPATFTRSTASPRPPASGSAGKADAGIRRWVRSPSSAAPWPERCTRPSFCRASSRRWPEWASGCSLPCSERRLCLQDGKRAVERKARQAKVLLVLSFFCPNCKCKNQNL